MKKIYVLVIFALVVLNVFLWGVLVINNLNEKNNRLNETTTYKKQPKVKNNGIKKTDSKISKFAAGRGGITLWMFLIAEIKIIII